MIARVTTLVMHRAECHEHTEIWVGELRHSDEAANIDLMDHMREVHRS